MNQRHIGSPRLLRRLMGDASPALRTLLRGLGQMLLGPPRNHRRHRRDAKLSGFFDGPLHAIELVDGHYQRNGQCGIGLKLGDQVEADLSAGATVTAATTA